MTLPDLLPRLLPRSFLRCALALAAACFACAAQAAPLTYGILSLISDELRVTHYVMGTGSNLDKNIKQSFATPDLPYDRTVLRSVIRVLDQAEPQSKAVLLWARDPKMFKVLARSYDEAPTQTELESAKPFIEDQNIDRLVLVLKHRGPTLVKYRSGRVGAGRLEGLGYYLDRSIRDYDDVVYGKEGLIAPHVYARVMLIDVANGWKLLRQVAITEAESMESFKESMSVPIAPWQRLSAEEKAQIIDDMLERELRRVMPELLAAK